MVELFHDLPVTDNIKHGELVCTDDTHGLFMKCTSAVYNSSSCLA